MNTLVLAQYTENERTYKELYYNDYEFRCQFNTFKELNYEPNYKILALVVKGKNYDEKREFLRSRAIEFQEFLILDCDIDLSMIEIHNCCEWFEKMANRFGLVKEFRENGII